MSVAFILIALLAIAFIPLVLFRPFHRRNTGNICAIAYPVMAWYWGVRIEFENEHRLAPDVPTVLIANHQDTEDMFFIESVIRPGTAVLGKWELIYVPFVGCVFWLAGNILIKRSNKKKAKQALQLAAEQMQNNNLSLLFFPEGTRNWGKPLPFKLGAFKLAIEAGAPIQPVCFSLRHKTLNYKRWRSGVIKVKCLEPIPTEGLTQDDALELAIKCRKLIEKQCEEITSRMLQST